MSPSSAPYCSGMGLVQPLGQPFHPQQNCATHRPGDHRRQPIPNNRSQPEEHHGTPIGRNHQGKRSQRVERAGDALQDSDWPRSPPPGGYQHPCLVLEERSSRRCNRGRRDEASAPGLLEGQVQTREALLGRRSHGILADKSELSRQLGKEPMDHASVQTDRMRRARPTSGTDLVQPHCGANPGPSSEQFSRSIPETAIDPRSDRKSSTPPRPTTSRTSTISSSAEATGQQLTRGEIRWSLI